MKRCPACKRVEPDDALAFCRADGTRLPILFHTRPVNGGAPLTLGVAFDVSGYRAGATPSGEDSAYSWRNASMPPLPVAT